MGTTVGKDGLTFKFEPVEGGKPWGISLMEVRRR